MRLKEPAAWGDAGLGAGSSLHTFSCPVSHSARDGQYTQKDFQVRPPTHPLQCCIQSTHTCAFLRAVKCSVRKPTWVGMSLQIIASIISLAESKAEQNGAVCSEITLPQLLEAYDSVLRQHNIVPEEDSHFYRFLLKLSLEPYLSWWAQLQVGLVLVKRVVFSVDVLCAILDSALGSFPFASYWRVKRICSCFSSNCRLPFC